MRSNISLKILTYKWKEQRLRSFLTAKGYDLKNAVLNYYLHHYKLYVPNINIEPIISITKSLFSIDNEYLITIYFRKTLKFPEVKRTILIKML